MATKADPTTPVPESKLSGAKSKLQTLRNSYAYCEDDSENGFGFVEGYAAACDDFEKILEEYLTS